MTKGVADRLEILLLLIASTWPLQVFAYVPWLNCSLVALSAGVLVAVWMIDLALTRKPRMPFEIAWVWVALLGVMWLAYAAGQRALPLRETGALLLFAATFRFVRHRNTVLLCLIASTLISGLCAFFSLSSMPPYRDWIEPLHPIFRKFATAYSLHHDGSLAFAYDLSSGVQILLVGLCCAVGVARMHLPVALRFMSMGIALFIAAALLALSNQAFPAAAHWGAHARIAISTQSVLLVFLILWGLARIAAKIEIDRGLAGSRLHRPILAGLVLAALSMILFPVEPSLWHGFMAALACAFAMPNRGPEPPIRYRGLLVALLLLPLVGLNLTQVYVENTRDPRNYEAMAMRALNRNDYELLSTHLDRFEDRFGIESRSQFWRARGYLEQGLAIQAATHFVHAQGKAPFSTVAVTPQVKGFYFPPQHSAFLPDPTREQVETFIAELRDVCSALPDGQRAFAYEQALVAAEQTDQAFAILEHRVNSAKQRLDGLPGKTLWLAYGQLLGLQINTIPREWDAAKMAGLLLDVGARVVDVNEYPPLKDLPDREMWAPAIAYAQCYRNGFMAFAVFRTSADGATHVLWKRDVLTGADWGTGGWQVGPVSIGDEQLRLHLVQAADGVVQERLFTLGYFPTRADPFTMTTDSSMLGISPNPAPGLPAILIIIDDQAKRTTPAVSEEEITATF